MLIALLIAALWCILVPENVENSVGIWRLRRTSKLSPHRTSEWMEQIIQVNSNKSNQRNGENVLVNALGHLGISAPEHVMTYVTLESPCKKMKPHLNVFERYQDDVPDKKLYVHLFKAVRKFYSIYCGRDERYQKLFSKWQDQLLRLHEQFIDCDGAPDWYENSNVTNLCESARNVVNCYSESLTMETSKSVAKAWKCLFQSVLNEAMLKPCQFSSSRREFSFEDVFSSAGNSRNLNVIFIYLFATLFNFFL